jgi:NADH-quinone oxidoreductase subunit L
MKIVDNFIMSISKGVVVIGKKVSMLQNANVRFYALFMLAGISILFIYISSIMGQ